MMRAGLVVLGLGLAAGLAGCERKAEPVEVVRPGEMSSAESAAVIGRLKAGYAAFNRGDLDGAVEPLDESVEWSEPKEFAGGGVYKGREAVKGYLAASRAGMEDGRSEPEEFVVIGERIVVFVDARMRPKGSFVWQEARLADVYTVHGGNVVAMRAFGDREEALRWARAK